jgi:hypothetical protein
MIPSGFFNSEGKRMKEILELFRKPSGAVMAQKQIEEAQREFIENMTLSEKHASLSAHHLNEANRVKNQIAWLDECIRDFNGRT